MPHKEKHLQDHISYSLVKSIEILAWVSKKETSSTCYKDSVIIDFISICPPHIRIKLMFLICQHRQLLGSHKLVVPSQETSHMALQGRRRDWDTVSSLPLAI